MIRNVMRLFALFLLFLQAQLVQSATNPAVPACKVTAQTPVAKSIQCDLRAANPTTSFLLKVNFSGSHDDTRLSMEPLLNGKPLTCAPGSLLYSEFEDGDISLVCKFSLPPGTDTARLLGANFKWFHAQFVDYELAIDTK